MAHIGYGYGSEWHLLQLLGRRRRALTAKVESLVGCASLEWLDHDQYTDSKTGSLQLREPRGLDFLPTDHPARVEWANAWPQSGNVQNWDAVARSMSAACWVLVEAKAHTGELTSSCGASAAGGLPQIKALFEQTRRELGIGPSADWLNGHYQYANRVTLLHFLRQRGVNAHLLFVYFFGDRADLGGRGRDCPASEAAWQASLDAQNDHVGITPALPISGFVHKLFLPACRVQILEPRPPAAPGVQATHPDSQVTG